MFGDVKGDLLDAFLCAIQGAWAWVNQEAHFGIPEYCDSNEEWITDPAVGSSAPVHRRRTVICSDRADAWGQEAGVRGYRSLWCRG